MSYSRSSVDEQVVKMSFDNSNFDSNVNQSINTLNSLDNKLSSLNKDNFSGLTQNWGNVADFFTVKGQVMFGILTRIGSEVVNLGLKFKNYLFKGIKDGIGEYETIINSTQTIYQNVKQSGASIGDVNAALDELNDYADKTIYNFGQMTNMIGRFTSAGVGLKKSVSTMKGLANAAALVGATPEKAEQAWLAVSKAMSSGTFSAYTWKSLELSNIAGEQFKNVITEVARANNATGKSGKNIDQLLEKYGDIKSSLQEGWLTKDIFNEAMQIMSGAMDDEALKAKGYTETQIKQLRAIADSAEEAATKVKTFRQLMDTLGEAVGSGWAQSFRILVGDLEQAKDLYTRISDVISNFIDNNAKIRNSLFKQIMDGNDNILDDGLATGRESFRKTIENMMAIVKTFLKSVKTGFLNIFPIDRISEAARKVMDTIQNFTRALVINNEEIKKSGNGDKILGWDTEHIEAISEAVKDLIRFFRGLASAVDIVWQVISQPLAAIFERIPFFQNFFKNTNDGIIGMLKNLGKFGDKITVFRNALKDTNLIRKAVGYFIDNIDALGKKYPILGAVLWVFKSIKNVITGVKDVFNSMNIKPLATLFGVIKFIAEAVWNILNFIFGIFRSIKDSVDWSFLDGPKKSLISFLKKLSDYGQGLISFEELTGKIGAKLKEIFSKLFSIFDKSNKASDKVTKSADKIQKAAGKTGSVISSVWEKVKAFFGSIGSFFAKIFEGADFSLDGIIKKIALIAGGVSAVILAVSHFSKTLEKISILKNISNLLLAGIDVIKAYERQIQSKMILNIAIAIAILAGAMVALAFVPYDKLENGLVVFSSFLAVLAVTLTPLLTALAKFNESLGKTKKELTQFDVLDNLVDQIGKIGKKLARALEFRMIGKMFKDVAISILIFVAAITALVFLFKYEEKNVIKAGNAIGMMILAIASAVTVLVYVMERTSKASKNVNTSIGTFASFFKLSGVAKVILAISASVLVLAFAMKTMSKIDPERLNTSFGYVMGLVGLLGTIAVGVAYFTSKAKDIGKLKKISVSMLGAMAGVAVVLLAMKPLIESLISDNDGKAWTRALIIFATVMTAFATMIGVMMKMAKKIGAGESGLIIWTNLEKFSLIMVAAMTAIAGVLFVISKMGDIPKNTMITIGIVGGVLVAFISLLALMTIVISKCKKTFSSNFALVVEKISFSIAAVVAAIGILAAGIGALIAAISSMNVPDSDVNKVQTNLLNKLAMISDIITKALPKLRKALYQIGWSVGSMFVSFIVGFSDSIISSGETMLSIADKFVNLVIDLLDKVVDILYTRRYDIARIIKRALEFIFAEITEILNTFFKKKDGSGLFTEDGLAKILGIGAATVGGVKVLGKVADGFNKIVLTVKNLNTALKQIPAFDAFGYKEGLKYLNANLNHTIGNLKIVKGLATIGEKITGQKYDNTRDATIGESIAAVGAIVVATKAVEVAIHGLGQLLGDELPYIRSDIHSDTIWSWDVWKALFTDKMFLMQVAIEGTSRLGELLITIILTIWHVLVGIVKVIATGIEQIAAWIWEILSALMALITWLTGAKGVSQSIIENSADVQAKVNLDWDDTWSEFGQIGKDWKQFAWTPSYEEYVDGAAQAAYNASHEVSENITAGAKDGLGNFGNVLSTELTTGANQAMDSLRATLGIASPSKVTEEIYRNVMYGCINGVKDVEQDFYSYCKHVTDTSTKILSGDAKAISDAWAEIANAMGYSAGMTEVRKTSLEISDYNDPNLKKTVELNRQYLDIIFEEAEAFKGLERNAAAAKMEELALSRGLAYNSYQAYQIIDAIFSEQEDKTKITMAGIQAFNEDTILSITEVLGKAKAAQYLAMEEIMSNYSEMVAIANDHKEEMIGMKKEEVEEFLKEEAIQRGMSTQAAADQARIITEKMFEGAEERHKITTSELNSKLSAFQAESDAYWQIEQNKVLYAQKSAELRAKLEKDAADGSVEYVNKYLEKLNAVKSEADQKALIEWTKTAEGSKAFKEFKEISDELARTNTEEKNLRESLLGQVEDIYKSAGIGENEYEDYFGQYYQKAMNTINKNESNKRGSFKSAIDSFLSMLGVNKAKDPELKWWDYNEEAKDSATLSDSEISTAVGAASDLKDGLESQRADLTPTFDLDQLASDAQKANGIVMSSLMAAQNASIGDYINQDSELNPFMKDRWQNVYNFTQNNYSPKALSRIDIYRQTQRQLSMSRGF